MLRTKQLISVLIILVCVSVYFIIEYFNNQNYNLKLNNKMVETFQGTIMNEKKLAQMSDHNKNLFTNIKLFLEKENEYYRNDIDISNYMIKKKFNIDQVLKKFKIVDGRTRVYGPNPKFDEFIITKRSHLEVMVTNLDGAINEINKLPTNPFYENLKIVLDGYKSIYNDRLSYYLVGQPNYLDTDALIKAYTDSRTDARQAPGLLPTDQVLDPDQTRQVFDILKTLNDYVVRSKSNFKATTLNIESTLNAANSFLNDSSSIDKSVKPDLIKFLQSRLNITAKMVVRDLSYNFIETVALLSLTGTPSEPVIVERKNALKESNIVVRELIELSSDNIEVVNNIIKYFSNPEKGSITIEDNEFQYFNAVDKNTSTLLDFCK